MYKTLVRIDKKKERFVSFAGNEPSGAPPQAARSSAPVGADLIEEPGVLLYKFVGFPFFSFVPWGRLVGPLTPLFQARERPDEKSDGREESDDGGKYSDHHDLSHSLRGTQRRSPVGKLS